MKILREGSIQSVHWEGTCIRCNAWVQWEANEIDFTDLVQDTPILEQDDKFPFKLREIKNFILRKDCPCCGLQKGITITRKADLPGT